MPDKKEKIWMWVLSIFCGSAVLSVILPPYFMVASLYLVFGIFILFSLPIVFYGICIYFSKSVIGMLIHRRPWLTWMIASIVVLFAASLLSIHLNSARKAEFDRLKAYDVTLISHPTFTRLVLLDDRSHEIAARKAIGKPEECDNYCGIYLANKSVEKVMKPSDPFDYGPFEKRRYAVFTANSDCNESVSRGGGCNVPSSYDYLRAGDLIVRTTDLVVPYQAQGGIGERFEIYIMSAIGPRLVARRSLSRWQLSAQFPFRYDR